PAPAPGMPRPRHDRTEGRDSRRRARNRGYAPSRTRRAAYFSGSADLSSGLRRARLRRPGYDVAVGLLHDGVLELADPVDLDPDNVAHRQQPLGERLARSPDAGGSARG